MPKELDGWSLRVTPLTMLCNGHVIGSATGFFWQTDREQFLFTNWHVLAGRHPKTMVALHKDAAVPDHIEYVRFIEGGSYDETVRVRVALEAEDGSPAWFQHSAHGPDVDVAAIQISKRVCVDTALGTKSTYIHFINEDITPLQEIFALVPPWRAIRRDMGADMFVLGFPLGTQVTGHFPIWKRASVASEMDILLNGRPAFLIDTATREGMSGAPVIHRTFDVANTYTDTLKPRPVDAFVGIYSGRHIGRLNEEAHLGVVWREELIREIVATKTHGFADLSRLP
jgi:hypothetical protein